MRLIGLFLFIFVLYRIDIGKSFGILIKVNIKWLGVNIDIPYYYLIACIAIASIVSIIPIAISGIGTRDATSVFLFSLLGKNREAAVSLSLLVLLMMAINGLIGYFVWIKYPIRLS